MPDRRWNLADASLVLDSHELSDGQLAERLPGRRSSEVGRLRDAIHAGHDPSADVTRLANVITEPVARLVSRRSADAVCARCGGPLRPAL